LQRADIVCFFVSLYFSGAQITASTLTELARIAGGSAKRSGGEARRAGQIRQCRSAVFCNALRVVTILLRA
jgi:hypothetical protein